MARHLGWDSRNFDDYVLKKVLKIVRYRFCNKVFLRFSEKMYKLILLVIVLLITIFQKDAKKLWKAHSYEVLNTHPAPHTSSTTTATSPPPHTHTLVLNTQGYSETRAALATQG
jgi:hypothetical protein